MKIAYPMPLNQVSPQYNASSTGHSQAFETSDGGYAVVGSYGVSNTNTDIMLVKMNSDASTYWVKTYRYSTDQYENGYAGIQTMDGGYVIAGGTSSSTSNGGEMGFVIKTNSDGSAVSWSRRYDGSGTAGNYTALYSIVQDTDGSYIAGGTTKPTPTSTNYDFYMVKISSNGTTQWGKSYGASGSALNEYGSQVILTNDGGYAMVGQTSTTTECDLYFVKTDNNGNVTWAKGISATTNTGKDAGFSTKQTADGGYIIAGVTNNPDLLLVKLTSDGTLSWAKRYANSAATGNNIFAQGVDQTDDGGYIVTGGSSTSGTGTSGTWDMLLMKTTSDGSFSWCKTFGSTTANSDEFGNMVQECSDGGFLISGYSSDPSVVTRQVIFLVKTRSDGTANSSSCGATAALTMTVIPIATPTIVSTPSTSVTWLKETSGSNITTPTITAKNPCNNSTNLPIEMLSFKAFCEYGKAVLRWVTASETNNDYFSIERSADGKDFQSVGKVYGFGTSSVMRSYEFTDNEIQSEGMMFYRIKQVDYNGQHEYFGPVSVRCNSKEIEINPTVSDGIYFITGDLSNAEISVYSLLGEKINPGNRVASSVIDISGQSSGIYFVKVVTPEGAKIRKVIKE